MYFFFFFTFSSVADTTSMQQQDCVLITTDVITDVHGKCFICQHVWNFCSKSGNYCASFSWHVFLAYFYSQFLRIKSLHKEKRWDKPLKAKTQTYLHVIKNVDLQSIPINAFYLIQAVFGLKVNKDSSTGNHEYLREIQRWAIKWVFHWITQNLEP